MNVYEIVKETLLAKMEAMNNGEKDGRWVKPWSLRRVRPMNWESQRVYSGVNLWLLDGCGSEFLTFKQIQELQKKNPEVKLRKGSKGSLVIFFKMMEKQDEQNKETEGKELIKQLPVLRYYYVYSLDDIEGLELRRPVATYNHDPKEAEQQMNNALTDYFHRDSITIRTVKSDGCYYTPSAHSITIPEGRYFKDYNRFLSSLAHEAIHSTAAKLNRTTSFDRSAEAYAFEELVAEFGASLLLATFGVADELATDNNAAYIRSWMQHIKDMPAHKLVSAMNKAQKAADFILGKEADNENTTAA